MSCSFTSYLVNLNLSIAVLINGFLCICTAISDTEYRRARSRNETVEALEQRWTLRACSAESANVAGAQARGRAVGVTASRRPLRTPMVMAGTPAKESGREVPHHHSLQSLAHNA
ncbi:hypothetical protein GWI33_015776 [Rhynchophorus ferrugineus]|uniref:Uncharacterized protein n=1 Tax=Rhynchophorus ferrugineus TaxID=354439 RepID=A0A834ICI4_RHYFE|nr:hypothetical protein GWI33_015776 [Rhynchophorus ferrugineus]